MYTHAYIEINATLPNTSLWSDTHATIPTPIPTHALARSHPKNISDPHMHTLPTTVYYTTPKRHMRSLTPKYYISFHAFPLKQHGHFASISSG